MATPPPANIRQLFGTDGIRGVAGVYPLDLATVYAIGRACGARLVRRSAAAKVVLGQDTRKSSGWIAEAIARGLRDAGCGFVSAGVLTTPGVAYLTRTHGFSAGVVISASHNPWQDNGIKLFGPNGMKLADEIEHEIETEIFEHIDQLVDHQHDEGSLMAAILPGNASLRADYENWLALAPAAGGPSVGPYRASACQPSPRSKSKTSTYSSTAPTEPPAPSHLNSLPASAFPLKLCTPRPPAATSTKAAEPCTRSTLPPNCSAVPATSISASPSTATPTALFSATPTATSSTAMPSFSSPPAT